MKRFPLILTYSFLGLALFASPVTEGQKKFIKGNIADKTAAVKDASYSEALILSGKGINFVLENQPVLGKDRDLITLAVASILSLPKDNEIISGQLPQLHSQLVSIFNLFEDDTVRIAVLNKLESMSPAVSAEKKEESVQLMNNYLSGVTSKNSPVVEKTISCLGNTGNRESFKIIYNAWKKNTFPVYQKQTEKSLISLSQVHSEEALKVIISSNITELTSYFNLIQKSPEISKNFKAEIAENTLSVTIINMDDNSGNSSDKTKLQQACLSVISEANWTRANNLAIKYFNVAKTEYQEGKMQEAQFINVIECITKLSSTDTSKTLSGYLAEMNKQAENNNIPAQNVVLTVIKSLGVLGDKSAFDNLLYVTYLNYPEEVKGAARDSLAKLKW